jgi:formate dehydrogenase (coenzyme F420) beta subunit
MIDELRQQCRRLLEEGQIKVVIGYGQSNPEGLAYPVFITRPDDVGQLVWNDRCFANLTAYLKRKEVRALGKPAIIVKPCDYRTLKVLETESQIVRSEIVVLAARCEMFDTKNASITLSKCKSCDSPIAQEADVVIGDKSETPASTAVDRFADLEAFMLKTPEQRLDYWKQVLGKCVKCYACRQACPLCYCEQCIVEKNRPQCISTSATEQGNFAWHIARAFHLAGRCVGCDECTRACPMGINLRLLNLSLTKAADVNFNYRAGIDPHTEPLVGRYSENDTENFIR